MPRFIQVSILIDVILAVKPFHGCDYFQNIEVGKSYDIFSAAYANLDGMFSREVSQCRWEALAPVGYILVLECDEVYMPLVRLQFFLLLVYRCFFNAFLPSLYIGMLRVLRQQSRRFLFRPAKCAVCVDRGVDPCSFVEIKH